MTPSATGNRPDRLILYDGVCAFCDHAVRWVIRADRRGVFRFAALQGATAAAVRARHPDLPEDLDSIIYVRRDGEGETVLWHAAAIFAICADLGGPWAIIAWLRWLPESLKNRGYRCFAANRYRWFGKHDTCPIPTAAERARFLD